MTHPTETGPRKAPADAAFYAELTHAQKREVQALQQRISDSRRFDGEDFVQLACWTAAVAEYRRGRPDPVTEKDDYFD